MAAPILTVPGILWFSLLQNPYAHKIPCFRGGGWKCQFYFYGRGDLSDMRKRALSIDSLSEGSSEIATQAAWERGRKRKFPKAVARGCKRSLDPESEKPLALVQNGVALAQKRFCKVQKALGRPLLAGSKTPCAPSRSHFREFPTFDPLSQAAWFVSQVKFQF